MGGLARKAQREAAKKAYKRFVKQWKEVVAQQSSLSPTGNRHEISRARKLRMEEQGERILGKRPTFKEWYAAAKSIPKTIGEKTAEVETEIPDLSWGD